MNEITVNDLDKTELLLLQAGLNHAIRLLQNTLNRNYDVFTCNSIDMILKQERKSHLSNKLTGVFRRHMGMLSNHYILDNTYPQFSIRELNTHRKHHALSCLKVIEERLAELS